MSRWRGRVGVFFLGVALGVVVSAAAVAIRRAVPPRQPSSSYVDRLSLFSVLSPRPGDVVFAGDSLIANGEWAELLEAPCVRNRGVGRETVAGLLRRADAVAAGSPTAVFLMVGINDLLDGRSAESLEPDYVALLSSLRAGAPATAIVVQSILPIGPPMPGEDVRRVNGEVRTLNARLPELAARSRARFVEVAAALTAPDGSLDHRFTSDGIHLNGSGYLRWTEAIRRYVGSACRR